MAEKAKSHCDTLAVTEYLISYYPLVQGLLPDKHKVVGLDLTSLSCNGHTLILSFIQLVLHAILPHS